MVSADMCEHDWPGSGCKECKKLYVGEASAAAMPHRPVMTDAAVIEILVKALKPFSAAWEETLKLCAEGGVAFGPPDWYKAFVSTTEEHGNAWTLFEFGDLRRAYEAVARAEPAKEGRSNE